MIINDVDVTGIAAMLCAVIVTAVCCMKNQTASKYACLAYAAAAIFFQPFLYFLPLAAYELFETENKLLGLSWAAVFVVHFYEIDINENFLLVLMSCGIAVYLKLKQQKLDSLENEVKLARDSGIENEIVLKKRNKILIDRQDDEISLAMLDERNRISREIHDNVGHLLTRSLYQLSAMQVIHKNDGQIGTELADLKATLTDAMDSIRSSVHNLHDESVDLKMRIQKIIDDFDFCQIRFKYECGDMPKELKYCFISIVREALSNVAKHSNATMAEVVVFEHPGFYQLIVEDNGTLKKKRDSGGIGLMGMRERIESFGGVFRVIDNKGFKLLSTVPKGAMK